jgi:hypothetical protein
MSAGAIPGRRSADEEAPAASVAALKASALWLALAACGSPRPAKVPHGEPVRFRDRFACGLNGCHHHDRSPCRQADDEAGQSRLYASWTP